MTKPTKAKQKAARKAWIAALRSGNYAQTGGQLRDGDCFCCLGVACEVLGIAYEGILCGLPDEGIELLGLVDGCGSCRRDPDDPSLVDWNDELDASFPKIADKLETGDFWVEQGE